MQNAALVTKKNTNLSDPKRLIGNAYNYMVLSCYFGARNN